MRRVLHLVLLPIAMFTSCAATTPGARPHDMSAAEHETEARKHGDLAQQHAAQYEPQATAERIRCQSGGSRAATLSEGICWSSFQNPTAGHIDEADTHRRQAADHRAASASLREAEGRACVGLAASDRDSSPFQHTEDIIAITPLRLSEFDARARLPPERAIGAVVTFRAVPGLSAEWLQRVIDCHLARNAALGHSMPEMPDCPLVPRGVQARVSSTGNGFAVAVSSNDPKVAHEILSRAERLRGSQPKSKDTVR